MREKFSKTCLNTKIKPTRTKIDVNILPKLISIEVCSKQTCYYTSLFRIKKLLIAVLYLFAISAGRQYERMKGYAPERLLKDLKMMAKQLSLAGFVEYAKRSDRIRLYHAAAEFDPIVWDWKDPLTVGRGLLGKAKSGSPSGVIRKNTPLGKYEPRVSKRISGRIKA